MYNLSLLKSIATLLVVSLPGMGCGHEPFVRQQVTNPLDAEDALTDRTVLFVYGGWEGHAPNAMRDLYVPWLKSRGADVLISSSLSIYADTSVMNTVDLIVQTWTLGQISGPQLEGLLTAVRNGAGFAGWHGGVVDAFRDRLDYHMLTGAQFLVHPGNILTHEIHVSDPNDLVMEGIHDFTVHTEQYYMLVDPNLNVLATTTFSGAHLDWIDGHTMPVMWKKHYGKGRVFVTTIGHSLQDFALPEVDRTLKRGIVWACRE